VKTRMQRTLAALLMVLSSILGATATTAAAAPAPYTCDAWIEGTTTGAASCSLGPGSVRVVVACPGGYDNYGPWVQKGVPFVSKQVCGIRGTPVWGVTYETSGG
jgi:hypothetical protein